MHAIILAHACSTHLDWEGCTKVNKYASPLHAARYTFAGMSCMATSYCKLAVCSAAALHTHAQTGMCRTCLPMSALLQTAAVKKGDRIAQLVLERIATPEVAEVEDLDASDRGAGGFGSTGGFTKQ